jgi:hypothetical protein
MVAAPGSGHLIDYENLAAPGSDLFIPCESVAAWGSGTFILFDGGKLEMIHRTTTAMGS